MNDNSLNNIHKYYNEKMINKKCNECNSNKLFIEDENNIIFSCGEKGTKCGIKINIKLPTYVDYNHMKYLIQYINEKVNTSILSKYIDIEEDKNIEEKTYIDNIQKLYEKQNNIVTKKDLIANIISKRSRLYNELDIHNRSEYIKKMIELNKLYRELLEIIENIDDIVIYTEPQIIQDKFKESKKPSSNEISINIDRKEREEIKGKFGKGPKEQNSQYG